MNRGDTMSKPGLTSDTGAWLVVVRGLNYAHFFPALCILYFTRYCLDKVIIYCFVMWFDDDDRLGTRKKLLNGPNKNAKTNYSITLHCEVRMQIWDLMSSDGWVGRFDWLNANMESTNLCGALFKSVHQVAILCIKRSSASNLDTDSIFIHI